MKEKPIVSTLATEAVSATDIGNGGPLLSLNSPKSKPCVDEKQMFPFPFCHSVSIKALCHFEKYNWGGFRHGFAAKIDMFEYLFKRAGEDKL